MRRSTSLWICPSVGPSVGPSVRTLRLFIYPLIEVFRRTWCRVSGLVYNGRWNGMITCYALSWHVLIRLRWTTIRGTFTWHWISQLNTLSRTLLEETFNDLLQNPWESPRLITPPENLIETLQWIPSLKMLCIQASRDAFICGWMFKLQGYWNSDEAFNGFRALPQKGMLY